MNENPQVEVESLLTDVDRRMLDAAAEGFAHLATSVYDRMTGVHGWGDEAATALTIAVVSGAANGGLS
jgi:hypothetical protein